MPATTLSVGNAATVVGRGTVMDVVRIATEVVAVQLRHGMWVICDVDTLTGIPIICLNFTTTYCGNCGREEDMCSAYPCLVQADRF